MALELIDPIEEEHEVYDKYWLSHLDIIAFNVNGDIKINVLLKPYSSTTGAEADAKYWKNINLDMSVEEASSGNMGQVYSGILSIIDGIIEQESQGGN